MERRGRLVEAVTRNTKKPSDILRLAQRIEELLLDELSCLSTKTNVCNNDLDYT